MYAFLFMYQGWMKSISPFFILEFQQLFRYSARTIWYTLHCWLYDSKPYQRKSCWTKVAQFFVRYKNFVQWKFVQYCFALAQSNSHKIMIFVGQKQQKLLGVTKTYERDVIFARLHVILRSLIQVLWIKKVFLNYAKK